MLRNALLMFALSVALVACSNATSESDTTSMMSASDTSGTPQDASSGAGRWHEVTALSDRPLRHPHQGICTHLWAWLELVCDTQLRFRYQLGGVNSPE